jgi:multiple RNA-binding domain-containing protein 1
MSSGKRKRDSECESKPQVGDLKSAVTGLATLARAEQENSHQKSSIDEQDERDLKKARRKEKKEKKEKKERKERKDSSQHKADIENVVEPKSEDLLKGHEIQDRKGKKNKEKKAKMNKETSSTEMDGNDDQVGNHIDVKENKLSKGTQLRAQVDDETKGGVEPIDDDALEPPEQSADQSKQQRRKSGISTDNDWLRAKTSRILDLIDETPLNARSAGPGPEERSPEPTVDQGAENTDQPGPSTTRSAPATHSSLSASGRLFVRNLPYSATETDMETLFSKYGHLDEVRLAVHFSPLFS